MTWRNQDGAGGREKEEERGKKTDSTRQEGEGESVHGKEREKREETSRVKFDYSE